MRYLRMKMETLRRAAHVLAFCGVIGLSNSALAATDAADLSIGCDYWGERAVNVLADYQVRVENGYEAPEQGTKQMIRYDEFDEGSTGKTFYDAILPMVFALASSETVFAAGRDTCKSLPDGAFEPENFF